jgi:hypothetical protein
MPEQQRDHTQRMGRKMPYTSLDGAPHPESFWCLGRLTIDVDLSQIQLGFIGYHDTATYDAGRGPIADAVKEYYLYGEDFAAAISRVTTFPTGTPISAEILSLAWAVAVSTEDVVSFPNGEDAEAVHTSFFSQAISVE